jgi:hypothetical protein
MLLLKTLKSKTLKQLTTAMERWLKVEPEELTYDRKPKAMKQIIAKIKFLFLHEKHSS